MKLLLVELPTSMILQRDSIRGMWQSGVSRQSKRSRERIHPPTLSNMEDTPKFKADGKQLTKALFPPAGP